MLWICMALGMSLVKQYLTAVNVWVELGPPSLGIVETSSWFMGLDKSLIDIEKDVGFGKVWVELGPPSLGIVETSSWVMGLDKSLIDIEKDIGFGKD